MDAIGGKSGPMERGVPRRRRPRPVVSAGVEALLLRGEELAKGWLLALVEDAPLDEAAAILAGDVARDGPRICDAVVRALYDEADLRRIERDGVLEPLASRAGELAGARSAEAAAGAVRALEQIIWSSLRAELAHTDPDLLADAAERLSLVTGLVLAAVLRSRDQSEVAARGPARVAPLHVARPEPSRADQPAERRAERGVTPGIAETGGTAGAAGVGGDAQEESRDALWIGALRDEIARAGRASLPLSLLLVELDEADRLIAVEPGREASATFGRFAQAVRTTVRRRDVLACETESRAWIIARDTGRAGAQALGTRIATSVPAEESWRGAPLTVSVGLAVLGEDGYNADALIDAAEQMRFAAQASGIGIVGEADDDADAEPPGSGPSLVS
jgi:GGDEF domain-containing protein